jgi:hypothetical protein
MVVIDVKRHLIEMRFAFFISGCLVLGAGCLVVLCFDFDNFIN